jgi:hypothetical protein
MFVEDVRVKILPIGGSHRWPKRFEPAILGPEIERVTTLVSRIHEPSYDPRETICDAIEELAWRMVFRGKLFCELIQSKDQKEHLLFPVGAGNLLPVGAGYLQLNRLSQIAAGKPVYFRRSEIWHLEMPAALGGSAGHLRMMNAFKTEELLGPQFVKQDLEQHIFSKHFSSSEYHLIQLARTLRAANRWGWTRRDHTTQYWTEYFSFFRVLTFSWSLAVLRDHIVEEFNRLLARLKIDAKVELNGLPTPNEILELREQLRRGEIGFSEAYRKSQFDNEN